MSVTAGLLLIAAVWVSFLVFAMCLAKAAATDPDRYWQGFADGELHQRLNDRDPSDN